MNKNDYKKYYHEHHNGAKQRGIEFLLSFDEWFQIWEDSGFLPLRGRGAGKYVMARFGDTGPYAVGNVKIILNTENVREGNKGKITSQKTKAKITASKLGVKFTNEHKKNISKSKRGQVRYQTDAEKAQRSETIYSWWREPGRKQRQSEAVKEWWRLRKLAVSSQ